MILAAALGAALAQPAPLPDGNAYVRSLLDRQRQSEDALNAYAYDLRKVREHLKADGRVARSETQDYEVFHVKGRPVRKLVAEDGKPLPRDRRAREERRVREMVEAIRTGNVVVEQAQTRLSRLLERYDFLAVGREEVEGRPAVILDITPRPPDRGARPDPDRGAKDDVLYRDLSGRLWVDEAEGRIVRLELRNNTRIKVGLGVGASVSGLSFRAEFRKVDGEVWLPARVETWAEGRILLVKPFRVRQVDEYRRYRRFQVDSEERVRPPS